MTQDARVKDILDFWFGSLVDAELITPERTQLWFSGSPEVDDEIRDLFEDDLMKAIAGDYDHWADDPLGRLALIILLDQFSRNIFRGSARAFVQDERALSLCLEGLDSGVDRGLPLMQRVFFYLPLEHCEDLEIQKTSVAAFESLTLLTFPETQGVYDSFLAFAQEHHDTIERFGRFPYRNEVLGRVSSSDEMTYLTRRANDA
jgi:uncharacterized protein (DUF924 family)